MRAHIVFAFLLLALGTAYATTTIVVGTCAHGDYEFNDLHAALNEAGNHSDVNIWICGTRELDSYESLSTDYITIGGGTIKSNNDTLVLNAINVDVNDLNVANILLRITAKGNATLTDVNMVGNGYYIYCADVNAGGDVTIDDVNVAGCPYGVLIRGADDLNAWSIYSGEHTVALKILPGAVRGTTYVHAALMPVVKTVTKIVEKNVPVQETVYRVPPEIYEKLKSCEKSVAALAKQRTELLNKINELESEVSRTNSQEVQTPWINIVGAAVAALAVGYLLGRIL
ncbi:MAG: hypothetical protein GXN93_05310 [Candidatus Diapherotrites archaeon]|nr:hypothetical protein [Candidatus Diapherotrites archaeon]